MASSRNERKKRDRKRWADLVRECQAIEVVGDIPGRVATATFLHPIMWRDEDRRAHERAKVAGWAHNGATAKASGAALRKASRV